MILAKTLRARYNGLVGLSNRAGGRKPTFLLGLNRIMAIMRQTVASKIEEIAQRVAESEGLELVEVEVKGGGGNTGWSASPSTSPTGVTHGDCELVSQQVGTILDVEDVVPGAVTRWKSAPRRRAQAASSRAISSAFRARRPKLRCASPSTGGATGKARWPVSRTARSPLETQPGDHVRLPFDQVEKANLKFEW